jgi:uncharacterized protein (DUF1778 family)
MKNKQESPSSKEKNYRIRFRDAAQLALIKKASKQQGISFNLFVIHVCETAAKVMLKTKPATGLNIVADAVNEALTSKE